MANTGERCRLYLITPATIEIERFADDLAAALGAGDAACLQLRLKDVSDDTIRDATAALMPIARAYGVAFIINDRPDLASELDADGAHIGQEDMGYAEARALVGADRILGVTCHDSRHLAMEAAEAGADYVAFGAFFPTTTKEPKTRVEAEMLTWWAELFEVPSVAIGGITIDNGATLVQAGANFLAVSAGVWDHPAGPAQAVADFNKMIEAATPPNI